MKDIYESQYVKNLFDRMSSSYSMMNYITSFGFSEIWRRQCVDELKMEKGATVVDLMTGMGECWEHILKKSGENSNLIGLDFSTEMINTAKEKRAKFPTYNIGILNENVLNTSIPNNTADYIVSGFGLKTFNASQLEIFAQEVYRILKNGGTFSFVEISIPPNKVLRLFYMFYLKKIIPILGLFFLGNPETYKMLGIYTQEYGDSKNVFRIFEKYNFEIEYVEYFFGCATGIKGKKIK